MSKMTMIERVAKVLCKFDTGNDQNWENNKYQAKAAIAAMREPTDEMMKVCETSFVRDGYKAMIDAALKE